MKTFICAAFLALVYATENKVSYSHMFNEFENPSGIIHTITDKIADRDFVRTFVTGRTSTNMVHSILMKQLGDGQHNEAEHLANMLLKAIIPSYAFANSDDFVASVMVQMIENQSPFSSGIKDLVSAATFNNTDDGVHMAVEELSDPGKNMDADIFLEQSIRRILPENVVEKLINIRRKLMVVQHLSEIHYHKKPISLASSPNITLGTIYQIFDSVNDLTATGLKEAVNSINESSLRKYFETLADLISSDQWGAEAKKHQLKLVNAKTAEKGVRELLEEVEKSLGEIVSSSAWKEYFFGLIKKYNNPCLRLNELANVLSEDTDPCETWKQTRNSLEEKMRNITSLEQCNSRGIRNSVTNKKGQRYRQKLSKAIADIKQMLVQAEKVRLTCKKVENVLQLENDRSVLSAPSPLSSIETSH